MVKEAPDTGLVPLCKPALALLVLCREPLAGADDCLLRIWLMPEPATKLRPPHSFSFADPSCGQLLIIAK